MPDIAPPPPPRPRPPSDDLITPEQRETLLSNGRRSAAGEGVDFRPVVLLRTPDANAVWLLVELDPAEPDRAYGLCDAGLGFPKIGHVSLAEIASIRGPLGLPVVTDPNFEADRTLSSYAVVALHRRRIDA